MKKYMLFCFSQYYPCGGMNDFKGYFDTLDEILHIVKFYEHTQILRIENMSYVESSMNYTSSKEEIIENVTELFKKFDAQ
jgi:hypothetical protein